MPKSRPDNHEQLPPLAAEDYTCDVCALIYSEITIDDAVGVIAGLPGTVRKVVSAIPPEPCRAQGRQAWSVAEYLCHLRDVYISYTIRLHRIRAEDRPALEPMFNDLRARRFRYNHCDIHATLGELSAAVAGFCEQIAVRKNRSGTASRRVCPVRIAPHVGWSVKRCTKVSITSATSGESAASAGSRFRSFRLRPGIWLRAGLHLDSRGCLGQTSAGISKLYRQPRVPFGDEDHAGRVWWTMHFSVLRPIRAWACIREPGQEIE